MKTSEARKRKGRVVALTGLLVAGVVAVTSVLLFREPILEFLGLSRTEPIRVFGNHDGGARSVVFVGDGALAASAGDDGAVRFWDVETGKKTRVFKGHRGRVHDIAVSADGRRMISGGADQTVRYWDVSSGRVLWVSRIGSDPVKTVDLSPDARFALSSTGPGRGMNAVHVKDANTGKLTVSRGRPSEVHCATFSPDGSKIVTGGKDAALVWEVRSGGVLHELKGHRGGVDDVACSPDGRLAVSVGEDKLLHVWDLDSDKQLHALRGHAGPVRGVAVSPDSRRALTAGLDGTMRLWDLTLGKHLRRYDHRVLTGRTEVWSVAFSSDGRRALSASADGKLRLWELPP